MTVNLYNTQSENNMVTKVLDPVKTVEGALRDRASLFDPVIMVDKFNGIANCNYAYIPEFGRYYYINNISTVRNGVFELAMHVDVLMTYATEIRSNSAIIARQANNWNLYLNDGMFRTYQNPRIATIPFPSGFTQQSFVLAVSGGGDSSDS